LTFLCKNSCSNDVDSVMISSVISTHLHVKLRNSSIQTYISELFVHIVVSCSRLILQNNTICLDRFVVLLKYLNDWINTWFTPRICPWALLSFCCFLMWYQNLDLAMTVFLANTLIAKTGGLASVGDGSLLPKTRYCLI
jgi:hypothetical protein